jgi:uncharacterized protein YndB with AHSA1/START domain
MSTVTTMTVTSETELQFDRRFDAPRSAVFEAMTTAAA